MTTDTHPDPNKVLPRTRKALLRNNNDKTAIADLCDKLDLALSRTAATGGPAAGSPAPVKSNGGKKKKS